jgi:hypothetical protein
MGGACSTYGGEGKKYIQDFVVKLKKLHNLEGLDVNGRIILEWILQKQDGRETFQSNIIPPFWSWLFGV